MPGFNPQQLNYKVKNANNALILVGDQPLAFAQTVTPSVDFGTEHIHGIGSAKPQENQQMKDSLSISLDSFALTDYGTQAVGGGVGLASILANNQVTICLVYNGVATKSYVGCVAQNLSNAIATNRPITEAINFLALDILDKNGVSILNGQNALNI